MGIQRHIAGGGGLSDLGFHVTRQIAEGWADEKMHDGILDLFKGHKWKADGELAGGCLLT